MSPRDQKIAMLFSYAEIKRFKKVLPRGVYNMIFYYIDAEATGWGTRTLMTEEQVKKLHRYKERVNAAADVRVMPPAKSRKTMLLTTVTAKEAARLLSDRLLPVQHLMSVRRALAAYRNVHQQPKQLHLLLSKDEAKEVITTTKASRLKSFPQDLQRLLLLLR